MLIPMEANAFAPGERALALPLAQWLADPRPAASVLLIIRERAPDEHLAFAHLLQLAERTPAELRSLLVEPALAARRCDHPRIEHHRILSDDIGRKVEKAAHPLADRLEDIAAVGTAAGFGEDRPGFGI